jgi:DMSO/TMAO reductase YedYZ molybdopterin-dependent catalytic subunit
MSGRHFALPKIDLAAWRLRIEGRSRQPLTLSHAELLARPMQTITATMEVRGQQSYFFAAEGQRRAMGDGRDRERGVGSGFR